MKGDYYRTLGVARTAAPDEIRKAFYRLAHRWHPDKNPHNREAEERFKEINEAYTILSDPMKKARYDTFGHAAFDFRIPPLNIDDLPGAGFIKGMGKILGVRFVPAAPDDATASVSITLEDVEHGTVREIEYRRRDRCPACDGTGDRRRASPLSCPICGGSGGRPAVPGLEGIEILCRACRGEGFIVRDRCRRCSGRGIISDTALAVVEIPAGLVHGQTVTVSGKGHRDRRGNTGDLHVTVEIRPHPVFTRSDLDISCEVFLPREKLASGAVIDVPGLKRRFSVRVPAGAAPGSVLRIAGQGLRSGAGRRGDLLVRLAAC